MNRFVWLLVLVGILPLAGCDPPSKPPSVTGGPANRTPAPDAALPSFR